MRKNGLILQLLRWPVRLGGCRLEFWMIATTGVLLPLLAINMSVAYLGNSVVFPLSPFFLENKLSAIGQYLQHRPGCWVRGHPDVESVVGDIERAQGLPRGLLGAVISVESASRPHRISFAGAMGPAQLIPSTARLMDVSDPFDTRDSIEGGARYLALQVRRYRNLRLAVAAYNAGPGAVRGFVPRNGETEIYVSRVMAEYERRRVNLRASSLAARNKPTRTNNPRR